MSWSKENAEIPLVNSKNNGEKDEFSKNHITDKNKKTETVTNKIREV